MSASPRPLPPLTEVLRNSACVRILDALFALDDGLCGDADTRLRWMEVLSLLWGSDAYNGPPQPRQPPSDAQAPPP